MPVPWHVLKVSDAINVHHLRSMVSGVALSIEHPSYLDLGPLNQML